MWWLLQRKGQLANVGFNYLELYPFWISAKSAGAIESTKYISAEELDPPNEFPGYDTKQSNGGASVMLELWKIWSNP